MMPKARAPPTARGGIDIVVDTAVADCALGNGTGENGVPLPSPHGPPAPLANGTCAAVGIGEKAAAAALEAAMSANDISVLDGAIVEAAAAGVDKKVLVKARTRLKVLRQSEKQAAVKEAAASLQAAMKAEGACATMDLEDALEKAMRAGVAKSSLEKARKLLARRAAAEKQATARADAEAALCDAMGEDDPEILAAAIMAAELAGVEDSSVEAPRALLHALRARQEAKQRAASALGAAASGDDSRALTEELEIAVEAGVEEHMLANARARLKVLKDAERRPASAEKASAEAQKTTRPAVGQRASARASCEDSLWAAMRSLESAEDAEELEDAINCAERANVPATIVAEARRLLADFVRGHSECGRCGALDHTSQQCPHITKSCFCCGAVGHLAQMCYSRHKQCTVCGRVGHLGRVCPASFVADLEERMLKAFDVFRAVECRMSAREKEEVLSGLEALGRQLAHWRSRDALLVEMEVSARRRSGGAAAADAASSWAWHAGPRQGAARGGRRELGA